MLGFNRHSLLVEHYRLAVATFQASKAAYETGSSDREHWREARASAAAHRANVRLCVLEYVHRLRDEGVAPEGALIAVKQRLRLSATTETPGAPRFEAVTLDTDAVTWTIAAYYDAA